MAILDTYLPTIQEKSVVAIASKIVSICEGAIVDKAGVKDKNELIYQEADYYLPAEENTYGIALTIKYNILIPSAGIDESNGDDIYILWPRNPQTTANQVREYLVNKYNLKDIGVIITDSKTMPLRWGTTGVMLAHSGFAALRDYVGKPDIFGKPMRVTKANVADGLAATAVLAMGEGSEQTPLAVISELNDVDFCFRNPSAQELEALKIEFQDDLYGSILSKTNWHTKQK